MWDNMLKLFSFRRSMHPMSWSNYSHQSLPVQNLKSLKIIIYSTELLLRFKTLLWLFKYQKHQIYPYVYCSELLKYCITNLNHLDHYRKWLNLSDIASEMYFFEWKIRKLSTNRNLFCKIPMWLRCVKNILKIVSSLRVESIP